MAEDRTADAGPVSIEGRQSDKPGISVDREPGGEPLATSLIEVMKRHGKPVMAQVRELAKLAFSKSRISPGEYFDFRLFDDGLSWNQKLEFAGLSAAKRAWKASNYDVGWRGLVWDKSAVYALLRGYGFPVPETLAVLHRTRRMRAIPTLRDADELADFLLKSSDYPLFCKPNSSMQSLGSVALTGVDRATNLLRTPNGRDIPLADFARSVAHYADKGYLIQKQLRPHPDLRNSIGEAVPTVRVVTLNGARGPRVFRAVWKIPGKGNYADNFWRPGNMLAALDYQTGRVVRLITGTGIKQQVLEALPQSASPASDLAVPDWNRLIELALTAADALPRLRLIGWDLAPTEDGPCIIEANDTPDFALPQYAERRGVLDSDFAAFARECEQQRKIDLTEIRKALSGGQQKDFRRLRRQAALSGQ